MDDALRIKVYERSIKSCLEEVSELMTTMDQTASRCFAIDDQIERLQIEREGVLQKNKDAAAKLLEVEQERQEFEEALEMVKERMNVEIEA